MATQEMFLSLDNRLRGREAQVGEQEDPHRVFSGEIGGSEGCKSEAIDKGS